jgi:hypothetical protein
VFVPDGWIDLHEGSTFVAREGRQAAACGLKQGREFSFDKALHLSRITDVAMRRSDVAHTTGLALKEHVVPAQMDARGFAPGTYLL